MAGASGKNGGINPDYLRYGLFTTAMVFAEGSARSGVKYHCRNGNGEGGIQEIIMKNPAQPCTSILRSRLRAATVALALICGLTMVVTRPVQAQTLTVLHNFTDGGDGSFPTAGLTLDSAGNFYGTTSDGGYADLNCLYGCGTVFKLTHNHSSWILIPVYSFKGGDDGTTPEARVIFGPDGLLYGTTTGDSSLGGTGNATAFRLSLSTTPCRTALCSAQ